MNKAIIISLLCLFISLTTYFVLHTYNSLGGEDNSIGGENAEENADNVGDVEDGKNEEDADESNHFHEFGDWHIVVDPSCTTDGSQTHECSCGYSETETILAFGHMYMGGECLFCGEGE